jgi:hypothetical protein
MKSLRISLIEQMNTPRHLAENLNQNKSRRDLRREDSP